MYKSEEKPYFYNYPFLGTENEVELVEESIQHAKEAITLDVKDGDSCCKNFLMLPLSQYKDSV